MPHTILEYVERADELFDKKPYQSVGSQRTASYLKKYLIELQSHVLQNMHKMDMLKNLVNHLTKQIEGERELFYQMLHQNAVSCVAMVAGYEQNRHVGRFSELFNEIPHRIVVSSDAMTTRFKHKWIR